MANTVSAGAAIAEVGFMIAAAVATGEATELKIEEGIGDYSQAIADVKARSAEISAEADRRIGATKEEGILSLKEQGAQAAFEGKMAMTQVEMVASSEEAKLGASGVRAKGSPLLAAQQKVDQAAAAADRTIEKGSAGIAIGGLRLKTAMADIGAEESMLTAQYTRRQTELERKKRELQQNKSDIVKWAKIGGYASAAGSFYKAVQSF